MPSIGEILQEARKKKGVTREVAAKTLKMKVERLSDLEEDRYDRFPAHVYVRSFLRHYADYLGVDSDQILKKFTEENPPPETRLNFEINKNQGTLSPIQRLLPDHSQSFLLTTTGRAVVITTLFIIGVAVIISWLITHDFLRLPNNIDNIQSKSYPIASVPKKIAKSENKPVAPTNQTPAVTLSLNPILQVPEPSESSPPPSIPALDASLTLSTNATPGKIQNKP